MTEETAIRPQEVPRIKPEEVRKRMSSGEDTLLVCAYEEKEKYEKYNLEGSISLQELQSKLSELSKDHELVFY